MKQCDTCGDWYYENPGKECDCDCEHTSLTPSGKGYICNECGAYLNDYYEVED
jgi:hypothetical protein